MPKFGFEQSATITLNTQPVCTEESTLKFSIADVAGFYSQLAGVLAGLAFAALIFLVSARLDKDRNISSSSTTDDIDDSDRARSHLLVSAALGSAYRMLLASFLALTVASLGYAVLAGSTVSSGRAATEEVVLAVAFSLAGGMLFYAVALTLEATENLSPTTQASAVHVSSHVRDVLVVIVVPLILVYSGLGLTDYTDVRYGPAHSWSALEIFGTIMTAAQLLVSWVAYPLYVKYRRGHSRSARELTISTSTLGWTFLIIVFASLVIFGLIDASTSTDPCTTLSPMIPAIAFSAISGSMFLLTTQVARFRTTR